jgi:hypothetical protein
MVVRQAIRDGRSLAWAAVMASAMAKRAGWSSETESEVSPSIEM